MHPYEQQYFNTLISIATERFTERAIYHNDGAEQALRLLKENPYGESIWLDRFVQSFFEEFLLDNIAGHCIVLQALANLPYEVISTHESENGTIKIEVQLERMAKQAFETLLLRKAEEAIEQNILFGR